jgi:hypothetical protein
MLVKKACTELDINFSEQTQEARERLMIPIMVGKRAESHYWKRGGKGSIRLQ